jgi:uncharacterized RDD family membrane protein YckC
LYGPYAPPPIWPGRLPTVTLIGPARTPIRWLAFFIDSLIMLVASFGLFMLGGLVGAWSVDAEWLRQYEQNPNTWPAIPALHVDLPAVLAMSAAIAFLGVAYAAVCWARFGGLPGQRALGLRVLDYDTGGQLSLTGALRRSLGIFGAAGFVMTLYSVVNFARLADYPIADTSSDLIAPDSPLYRWLDPIAFGLFLGSAWLALLAISTMSNQLRRGVQDRMSGSMVISVRKVPVAWYPGYPAAAAPTIWAGPGPASAAAPGRQAGPQPGPQPAPGWTPPGYWTPPGQPAPTDWQPPQSPGRPDWPPEQPSGQPARQAPDSGSSLESESPPEPDVRADVPPWKALAQERLPASLADRGSAPLTRRVVAYGIDCVIVLTLFSLAFATFLPDSSSAGTTPNERISIFAGLAGGAMQLVYFVLGWTYWRATLGQRIAGIAVVCESDGKGLSAMDALVRWAVVQGPFALASIVPLAVAPVVVVSAGCWSAFLLYSTQGDERGQGLHDHFVKTRVVSL